MIPDRIRTRRSALAQAVPHRFSCHHFSAAPSLTDWSSLSYLCGRWEYGDLHLRLVRVPESFLAGGILRFGRITGTDTICVLSGPALPETVIQAGALAEAFVLECTALGLATCWITGSILRKPIPLAIPQTESIFAFIAIGKAGEAQTARHRKELSALCIGDWMAWPEAFQKAAAYIREAPSAANAQPYHLEAHANTFSIRSSDRSRLDLGAALLHADLALEMPHTWTLRGSSAEPEVVCTCSN